ncbi:hypothetical protein PG999_009647 [Apiospora kogelbergensis]|uniref:Uncharacterized protein n=1 Tax=Apiospora kogelbergensis TaxID=1337665 RepID=A0AAW0QP12_9PEZI
MASKPARYPRQILFLLLERLLVATQPHLPWEEPAWFDSGARGAPDDSLPITLTFPPRTLPRGLGVPAVALSFPFHDCPAPPVPVRAGVLFPSMYRPSSTASQVIDLITTEVFLSLARPPSTQLAVVSYDPRTKPTPVIGPGVLSLTLSAPQNPALSFIALNLPLEVYYQRATPPIKSRPAQPTCARPAATSLQSSQAPSNLPKGSHVQSEPTLRSPRDLSSTFTRPSPTCTSKLPIALCYIIQSAASAGRLSAIDPAPVLTQSICIYGPACLPAY